jgi:hypothetical protein
MPIQIIFTAGRVLEAGTVSSTRGSLFHVPRLGITLPAITPEDTELSRSWPHNSYLLNI